MKTELPENEAERLNALRRYQILDTPPEPAFDRIAEMAANFFHVANGSRAQRSPRRAKALRREQSLDHDSSLAPGPPEVAWEC